MIISKRIVVIVIRMFLSVFNKLMLSDRWISLISSNQIQCWLYSHNNNNNRIAKHLSAINFHPIK